MKNIIFSFMCILVIASCKPQYTKNSTILKAEALLNTYPDSSFQLLSSFPHPEQLPEPDYAAWCMNYTHSQLKLQTEIKSDSLIKISIAYYEKAHDNTHEGIALYMEGNICRLNKKNKEAMLAFKTAEKLLSQTDEKRILGLVQFGMGYISMQDELYNHSLNCFKKSLVNLKLARDMKTAAYACYQISEMYVQLDFPFDSVMYYSGLALKYSKESSDSINYYSVLARQGELLYQKELFRSKEFILEGFNHLPQNKGHYAAFLAYIYSELNQPDSAKYYLKISGTDTTNISTKIILYKVESILSEKEKKYKDAYELMVKAYNIRDSVFQKDISSQLYRIDRQYDLTEKEKENAALTISNQSMLIWIGMLVIAFLTTLIIIISISNYLKRQRVVHQNRVKVLEIEKEAEKLKNNQKKEILYQKLNSKIENTLRLDKIKKGYLQKDNRDALMEEISRQSILSEDMWLSYIEDVNKLFDNGIYVLKEKHTDLSYLDQMVIALVCLDVSITDSCSLLGMIRNTMYVRRKTIKKRLRLDSESNLEEWILENVVQRT